MEAEIGQEFFERFDDVHDIILHTSLEKTIKNPAICGIFSRTMHLPLFFLDRILLL